MQDCNLVLYKNANTTGAIPQNAIFASGTSGRGNNCQFIVSSQQGGVCFIVNDANQVLFGEDAALRGLLQAEGLGF